MRNRNTQISTSFGELCLLLGKFQNELQANRELLTLRTDFNPQCLFRYLSMGEQELTKTHLIYFMEQNSMVLKEEEAKLLFTVYGYKDKINYTDFLNYIYPYDIETIKTISTVHCKKYIKNENEDPSEEILCNFLLLLMKQMEFLRAFEQLKNQKLPLATRESIKKWIKQLKRTVPSTGISSEYVFTFPEFKTILKKLKNLPQRKAQPICRRLSLQKESFIGLDQLQVWMKPWFKNKPQEFSLLQNTQTLFQDIEDSLVV